MSELIPIHRIALKSREQYRRSLHDALTQRAKDLALIIKDYDIVYRDGLGHDLGLPTPNWVTPPLHQGWNQYIRGGIKQGVIGFFGVVQEDCNPVITTLRVNMGLTGCITLGLYNLQSLYDNVALGIQKRKDEGEGYGDFHMEGWFDEPVVFNPLDIANIEVYSSEDKPQGEKLVPLIIIAEHRGRFVA